MYKNRILQVVTVGPDEDLTLIKVIDQGGSWFSKSTSALAWRFVCTVCKNPSSDSRILDRTRMDLDPCVRGQKGHDPKRHAVTY